MRKPLSKKKALTISYFPCSLIYQGRHSSQPHTGLTILFLSGVDASYKIPQGFYNLIEFDLLTDEET